MSETDIFKWHFVTYSPKTRDRFLKYIIGESKELPFGFQHPFAGELKVIQKFYHSKLQRWEELQRWYSAYKQWPSHSGLIPLSYSKKIMFISVMKQKLKKLTGSCVDEVGWEGSDELIFQLDLSNFYSYYR